MTRNRKYTLSGSEVNTIPIFYHAGQFRNLKHIYLNYVKVHFQMEISRRVFHNRLVELLHKAAVPNAFS